MEDFLKNALGKLALDFSYSSPCHMVFIPHEALLETVSMVSNHHHGRFEQLMTITAVDDPSLKDRFCVSYHFLSMAYHQRLIIQLKIDDSTPIASITRLFACANWYEREVFDMFGIEFLGHPNLKRLLNEEDFIGYPLRKDFPVTGYTQSYYDHQTHKVEKQPADFSPQPYRHFHLGDSWKGHKKDF
jgi:NADH/F420H2 dehydrogenase subunit C